jgi:Leucine-rich repeat (LRR) protein
MKWLLMIMGIGIVGTAVFYTTRTTTIQETGGQDELVDQNLTEPQTGESNEVVTNEDERLDLSGQQLSRVPEDVFQRRELTYLDLSGNRLTGALPAEVRHLTELKVLDLSDNDFTGVPAEIGQLTKLQILDLSNNRLTGLPHELGNLKDLKTLDLRGNNPSDFDMQIIRESLVDTVIILD